MTLLVVSCAQYFISSYCISWCVILQLCGSLLRTTLSTSSKFPASQFRSSRKFPLFSESSLSSCPLNAKPWHNRNLTHLSVHVKRCLYKALYCEVFEAIDSRIDIC